MVESWVSHVWLTMTWKHRRTSRRGLGPSSSLRVSVAEESELLSQATQEAARLGHDRLFLVTFDREGFYTRLGWSPWEHTTYCDLPVTIMTRDLTRLGT